MIKLALSIFMLLIMPAKLLFLLVLFVAVCLFFVVDNFIKRDTYYEAHKEVMQFEKNAEKVLNNSCEDNKKCKLVLYAKNYNDDIMETFSKTLHDEEKNKTTKTKFLAVITKPIQKLVAESDIKKLLQSHKESNCLEEDGRVICHNKEVVAIFSAENCTSCNEKFKKEFKLLEKKYYKSLLIKLTHKVYTAIFKFFGISEKGTTEISNKIKDKVKDIAYDSISSGM